MEKLWSRRRRGGLLSLSSTTANLIFKTNLSTSAAATVASSSNAAAAATKPKRKKNKKNLFEVAQFLPNWGIGYHLAKSHWNGVSYQITKLNLYKDGKHGKAWGIVHKEGKLEQNLVWSHQSCCHKRSKKVGLLEYEDGLVYLQEI